MFAFLKFVEISVSYVSFIVVVMHIFLIVPNVPLILALYDADVVDLFLLPFLKENMVPGFN
jgi:hypothetical protein